MNGYPENPDPLAPARGVINGLIFAGAFWLAVLVAVLLVLGT